MLCPSAVFFPWLLLLLMVEDRIQHIAVKWTFNLRRYGCYYILSNAKPQFHQIELFSVKLRLKTSQPYPPYSSQAVTVKSTCCFNETTGSA